MIDLGIDESASPQKRLLVMSAIIGQTSHMKKLADRWSQDLKRYGVDFFHAKDHWNKRARPYHGLSMTKRKALLDRLIDHIHRYCDTSISVHIDPEEYKRLTSSRFRTTWGSPYAFCMQMLFALIGTTLKDRQRGHEGANMLLEAGHANAEQACEIASKAIDSDDAFLRLITCAKGGKKDNPILQAADLFAYGLCQWLARGDSQMFRQLLRRSPERFQWAELDNGVIEVVKSDIEAHLQRSREARKLQRTFNVIRGEDIELDR